MKVYNYDTNGYYLGECTLDDRFKNPMHGAIEGEEEYFIPAQAAVVKPLKHKEKHKIKWNGEAWEYEEILIPEADAGKEVVWNLEKQEYEQLDLPPTVEQIREINIALLKLKRNNAEKLPVSCLGNLFDYDDDSRDRINEAIGFMERNRLPTQAWTLADNTATEVTVNELYAVKDAAAIRSGKLHEEYNNLKILINMAKSEDEIKHITENSFSEFFALV